MSRSVMEKAAEIPAQPEMKQSQCEKDMAELRDRFEKEAETKADLQAKYDKEQSQWKEERSQLQKEKADLQGSYTL